MCLLCASQIELNLLHDRVRRWGHFASQELVSPRRARKSERASERAHHRMATRNTGSFVSSTFVIVSARGRDATLWILLCLGFPCVPTMQTLGRCSTGEQTSWREVGGPRRGAEQRHADDRLTQTSTSGKGRRSTAPNLTPPRVAGWPEHQIEAGWRMHAGQVRYAPQDADISLYRCAVLTAAANVRAAGDGARRPKPKRSASQRWQMSANNAFGGGCLGLVHYRTTQTVWGRETTTCMVARRNVCDDNEAKPGAC